MIFIYWSSHYLGPLYHACTQFYSIKKKIQGAWLDLVRNKEHDSYRVHTVELDNPKKGN